VTEYTFKGKAFISRSSQDKEGCENVVFQFDASQAVEVAKLKLMGRDLENHLPNLLEVVVKIDKAKIKGNSYKAVTKEPKQRHHIPRRSA